MPSRARTAPSSSATPAPDSACEAARYALLRRLAPSMRHHLVVNLQPIGMIYEVLDRRLRADEPDLREVHESAQKINGFARAALDSSLDMITWLSPPPEAATTVADGVRECLGLLATSLTFRGYALRNDVMPLQGRTHRSAMRTVLSATLLHLTDEHAPPAEISLSAQDTAQAFVLKLALREGEGESGFTPEPAYRPLQWNDVQALASAESVELVRETKQAISLVLPRVAA
ncbi:hypothetical protein [Caenimonas aquaedulcis]|uniref:Uncharacterized protein n=1 Tax=Caenimonas aquaedulcis TaxID=2793270 RepID=A0A931H794_9BURK|nr:hypothetical protein [Caenimonas aquaedulcis]MBG9389670.1 hypothetical protein [Caenimonas aquaedulcis]